MNAVTYTSLEIQYSGSRLGHCSILDHMLCRSCKAEGLEAKTLQSENVISDQQYPTHLTHQTVYIRLRSRVLIKNVRPFVKKGFALAGALVRRECCAGTSRGGKVKGFRTQPSRHSLRSDYSLLPVS